MRGQDAFHTLMHQPAAVKERLRAMAVIDTLDALMRRGGALEIALLRSAMAVVKALDTMVRLRVALRKWLRAITINRAGGHFLHVGSGLGGRARSSVRSRRIGNGIQVPPLCGAAPKRDRERERNGSRPQGASATIDSASACAKPLG